ncbi:MAG: hypothetical protein IT424_08000 [Pirellulales bacterium]|nr:hypothetical protein [Pirellulales bacterium]
MPIALACLGSVAPSTALAESLQDGTSLNLVERMLPKGLFAPRAERDAAPGSDRSLARIEQLRRRMLAAEAVLATDDVSGRASAIQQEVIYELDAMLTRLERQCDQFAAEQQPPGAAPPRQPKAGPQPAAMPGESAATTTAAAVGGPVDRAAISRLVRDAWGELPQRQRDELLQPLAEEFLPQYAADIADYFEALAERAGEDRSPPEGSP